MRLRRKIAPEDRAPGAGSNVPHRSFTAALTPTDEPDHPMKRIVVIGTFAALLVAILVIAATWSAVTPVNPAVGPDTASTPNPTAQRK